MSDIFSLYKEYIKLQKLIGTVLDCPGKGGNISVKENNVILVKPSGVDLKCNSDACVINLEDNTGSFINGVFVKTTKKPTMEIGLHKVIPYKYVAHYHPVYVLPWICTDYYELTPVIDALPGEDLFNKIKEYKDEHIIYLKNHGVVIAADTLEEVKELYDEIKNKFFRDTDGKYTPDDLVDKNSEELWLFRNAIENIARINNIKLKEFTRVEVLDDENEKYRMEKMK